MRQKAKSLVVLMMGLVVAAWAQYPGHLEKAKKPNSVLRSIAVLEWTGQAGKPSASRIIPISVFDGEEYQPGGLYLAKPEPLALEPGTEYLLQDAGVTRGMFDIYNAHDVDGYWFGYGAWKQEAAPVKRAKPKQGRNMPQVVSDSDGRPHFKGRDANGNPAGGGASPAPDTSNNAPPPPAGDPDRPTLRRRADSGSPTTPSSGKDTDSVKNADNSSPETPLGSADPDRPRIMHGQQTPVDDVKVTELTGVPNDLQQMVAVSDATDRETHAFVYLWSDPADSGKMQEQMQTEAAAAIAASEPAPAKATTKTHTAIATAQRRKAAAAPVPPKLVFTNEHFKAYELTYSGGATLVYTAQTQDKAGKTKYVTLIAQPDFNGVPKVLFKSVTDDAHLDLKPKMRLVDAVDARANNRGDLLFELRRPHDREFVIYSVSGGQVMQEFTTGSLPNSQG